MPREPRHDHGRRGRGERARQREQLGDGSFAAVRPVEPDRDERGDDEQCEAQLEIDVAAAERGRAHERDEGADRKRRPQRELSESWDPGSSAAHEGSQRRR